MAFTLPALPVTGTTIDSSWGIAVRAALNESAAAKVTTKGDLTPATASGTLTRRGVGADGTVLTAASGQADGMQWVAPTTVEDFFTAMRTQFRANRRRVAEFGGTQSVFTSFGFGRVSSIQASVVTGETVNGDDGSAGAGTHLLDGGSTNTTGGAVSPAHSPRFLARVLFPAAHADVTSFQLGFFSAESSLTANGAYLRIATTGNVFFVTRQGASETTTDLGVLSRVAILGFEIETADAGVTWVCRNQAGTALATHTTNVPTAATALLYGFGSVIANNPHQHGVAYMYVEGTFA